MDCTTDITHQEQLTLVLRFYNCKLFAVEEHFIGFVDISRTTGEVLTETFLKHLTEAGLDLLNCRGQSYDNEANMKRIHSVEIANSSEYDTFTKFQANNLAKQMSKFTFMVSLSVWYDILFQSPDYDLSTAQTEIDQLFKYFNDLRDKGIKDAKHFAMEIAEELEVSPQF
ncbi:uncharacterized protein LOC136081444 [Hydra vulgaris]|uniref:Uncharacterized protein LOC136081444 n=1 Tax=Hydra vulgaris TaxID=6087 RepID=A0ABM4C001_HYDVU